LIACSFCGEKPEVLFQAKDLNRKISKKKFIYSRCPSCDLISISEIPDNLGSYYAQEYYQIPSLDKLKNIAKAEKFKIEMIKKFVTSGALLEIGPAFGVFAYQAKEAGFKVDTIEMNERCCKYLEEEVGVNVIKSDMPHKAVESMGKHDVIAMWHVLEHLANPWEALSALANNLSPGGMLVIATPNPQSFQFRLMGAYWPHADAPRHLNLFPRKVLEDYLERHGLKLVMITTDDHGGRSWNRFGWQRLLMNCCSGKLTQRICFVIGYLVSFPMALWDRKKFEGCAYTAIFQKKVAE